MEADWARRAGSRDLRYPPWKVNPPGAGTRSKRVGSARAGDQGLRFPLWEMKPPGAATGLNPAGCESTGDRALHLPRNNSWPSTQPVEEACLISKYCQGQHLGWLQTARDPPGRRSLPYKQEMQGSIPWRATTPLAPDWTGTRLLSEIEGVRVLWAARSISSAGQQPRLLSG